MKKTILLILTLAIGAGAKTVWIGQNSAGNDNGASAENCHSINWHNASTSWSATPGTPGKICPGDTVKFCTDISTNINPVYGGIVGYWIVYNGNMHTFNGLVNFSSIGDAYFEFDNMNIVCNSEGQSGLGAVFFNGNTDAGSDTTKTANHLRFNHINSSVAPVPGCVFNLQFCRHACVNACTLLNTQTAPIMFQRASTGYDTVQNCYIANDTTITEDVQMDGIDIGDANNMMIQNNTIINRSVGEGAKLLSHNDCVEWYAGGGSPSAGPSKITMRYNTFIINTPKNDNVSWNMLENSTDSIWIYDNLYVAIRGGRSGNGLNINSSGAGAKIFICNNTFVAIGGGENLFRLSPSSARLWFKNNIIYDSTSVGTMTQTYSNDSVVASNNCYYSIGTPSKWTITETGSITGNPKFNDKSSNWGLQSSSPCINAGVDAPLGAVYVTDYLRLLRVSPWDIGAIEHGGISSKKSIRFTVGVK